MKINNVAMTISDKAIQLYESGKRSILSLCAI